MTRSELIKLGGDKVRDDERLILFYLEEFEKMFGRKPNCAPCTFKTDWKRFTKGKQTKTFRKMETEKTFELKRGEKEKIHTYRKDGRPFRTYGNRMTEDFAKAYLKNGTKEEIKRRKAYFHVLPGQKKQANEPEKQTPEWIAEATHKQLDAYAEENGIDFGEAKKVAEKREVIAKYI